MADYENRFQKKFNITLNEGLLLCSLRNGAISSGEIAQDLDLSCSNTSKVIRSVETKGFVQRALGDKDKRQMYFILTDEGKDMLKLLEKEEIQVPDFSKLFKQ